LSEKLNFNCLDIKYDKFNNNLNLIYNKRSECTGEVLPKFSGIQLGFISSSRNRFSKLRKDGGIKEKNKY